MLFKFVIKFFANKILYIHKKTFSFILNFKLLLKKSDNRLIGFDIIRCIRTFYVYRSRAHNTRGVKVKIEL